jgi:hypothetical protein
MNEPVRFPWYQARLADFVRTWHRFQVADAGEGPARDAAYRAYHHAVQEADAILTTQGNAADQGPRSRWTQGHPYLNLHDARCANQVQRYAQALQGIMAEALHPAQDDPVQQVVPHEEPPRTFGAVPFN